MLMIAPIIRTIPMILKTEFPVAETFATAFAVVVSVATFVTSLKVTKNAKTPTANMIKETTTPIIAPGSINAYLVFIFSIHLRVSLAKVYNWN